VAHLLHEFVLELRYRYETGFPIPGVPSGQPDHAYCLLHQKLQLLNCCIERKKAREGKAEDSKGDDSDDEFFDCDNDEGEKVESKDLPIWSRKPEGRTKTFNKMRLLEHDDYLYVPECQEPAPLSEDQLAEQAEVMLQLGDDREGSEVRTRMQMGSLLSDMESFKAANPGAILADFVRWHSPRDWVQDGEDEEGKGHLSARMEAPGNAWSEAWTAAKPVPARRQRRLFDDTKEAEKALQYWAALKPGDAAQCLAPVLLHAAAVRVEGETRSTPSAAIASSAARAAISQLSRYPCAAEVIHYSADGGSAFEEEFRKRRRAMEEAAAQLAAAEAKISQAKSLRVKFLGEEEAPGGDDEDLGRRARAVVEASVPHDREGVSRHMADFVWDLCAAKAGGEVLVLGAARGPAGRLIRRMFWEAKCANAKEDVTVDKVTCGNMSIE